MYAVRVATIFLLRSFTFIPAQRNGEKKKKSRGVEYTKWILPLSWNEFQSSLFLFLFWAIQQCIYWFPSMDPTIYCVQNNKKIPTFRTKMDAWNIKVKKKRAWCVNGVGLGYTQCLGILYFSWVINKRSLLVAKNFMTLSTEKRSCNKFQKIIFLNSVEDGQTWFVRESGVDD